MRLQSPRFSNSSNSNAGGAGGSSYEGRSSPETYHRDIASPSSSHSALPSSSSSSRLFGGYSSTSSSGTATNTRDSAGNRDSPSRSPKTSLFSNTAYGSSRSLMLGSGGPRGRQSSGGGGGTIGEYQNGNAMDEDAPPTDTLDEFDDGPGAAVGAGSAAAGAANHINSPPTTSSALAPASRSGPSMTSPQSQNQQLPNGSSSSSSQQHQQMYKITIFGFPSNLSNSILSHFQNIGNVVYNSLDASSSSSSNQRVTGGEPDQPQGANWVTIGYESEWSALRALRRNGEILGGTCMIGVRWADGTPSSTSSSSNTVAFPGSSSNEQQSEHHQQQTQPTVSASTARQSTFGTPARVLPASAAWKPNTAAGASQSPSKASTVSRISELGSGRMDPSIFKDGNDGKAGEGKQSSGVVGTLTNLIFGF